MVTRGSPNSFAKQALVASGAVVGLFGDLRSRLGRMTAELWPRSSLTRSPSSSVSRSLVTITAMLVRERGFPMVYEHPARSAD